MSAEPAIAPDQAAKARDSLGPQPFRVIQVNEEIDGCGTLTVVPESDDAAHICSFSPGQFHMVYIFGQGEIPVSISGNSANSCQLVFTVMGVGAVSRAMARLKVGDMIGLRGPFGSTWPLDVCSGKDVMVIAGGLGLAPLRPTIYSVMENRDCYNRAMLLYGSRSPDMLLFPDQLKEWEQSGKMEVSVTVDSADKNWKGNVGVVTELINKAEFSPDNMLAMLCGPEVMMRFCAYALLDRGMKPEDIYVSMERNMKCGVGQCGRCQYGPYFVCKDGPVFSFDQVEQLFKVREV